MHIFAVDREIHSLNHVILFEKSWIFRAGAREDEAAGIYREGLSSGEPLMGFLR